LRRSWIVNCLGGRLGVRRYGVERMAQLLALPEHALLSALGVESVAELEARYGPPRADDARREQGSRFPLHAICRHDDRYPRGPHAGAGSERAWAPPPVLHVAGNVSCLQALADAPAVAIVGTRRATDYGLDVAYRIASELSATGVSILGGFAEGIARAAHAGALNGAADTVTVMASGVERACPAGERALYAKLVERGCAISETPLGSPRRHWANVARGRVIAGLASLVLVVEAEDRPSDLALPRFALALGRAVVAVPGRVTSPSSAGSHALIAEAVPLVRDTQDVLDALYGVGAAAVPTRAADAGRRGLSDVAARVLELIARGADSADSLVREGLGLQSALVALAELELAGALTRGDGGRYLPCGSYASASRARL
jgi:DNA processing protein